MANIVKDFDSYMDQIKNNTNKVGELTEAKGKVTAIQEYKSPKSGNKSLKMTIQVEGGEISAYLGFSTEKSIEITKARLTKLCIAAVGMAETKKIFEDVANDSDIDTEVDFILEFSSKINKKLRKNPTEVIVSRTKNEEKGVWDVRWHLPEAEEVPLPEENKAKNENTDDFLGDLVDQK